MIFWLLLLFLWLWQLLLLWANRGVEVECAERVLSCCVCEVLLSVFSFFGSSFVEKAIGQTTEQTKSTYIKNTGAQITTLC